MADGVRVWLVERDYDDKGLLRLVYATPDGERVLEREQSPHRRQDPTAAATVDPARLSAVEDRATRERYAAEAARMADRHDPGEAV